MTAPYRVEARHLAGRSGKLFVVSYSPLQGGSAPRSVLYLPPFAEEMNKARRMAALQARALACAGWWVMQPDLFGTGDSEGDFGDATWDTWLTDALLCHDELEQASGAAPVLWGLRAGCLLVSHVARLRPQARRLVMWQPVASGKVHLQQFLRLKVAGAMFGGAEARVDTGELRRRLTAGETIEVAGYAVAPQLASGMDAAQLDPVERPGRVSWFELGAEGAELSPVSRKLTDKWSASGWRVDAHLLPGAAFWQTQEIEEVKALVSATTTTLLGDLSP